MRPPDLYEVVCQLSPTEMWYHLRFVPMQEAAAAQKAASGTTTWRQMSGVRLMAHEISHVGNKPFMIGFA